jgi:hypothetical protein
MGGFFAAAHTEMTQQISGKSETNGPVQDFISASSNNRRRTP